MFKLNANGVDALSAPAHSNRRDWKYFDEKLAELRVNDIENIIARGRILIEAHDELERGSYEATVKRHFDLSYARKLRIIAAHPVISNRAHVHALPPSVFTLYELTKLPAALLRETLNDGSINAKLERKDVARWRKGEGGKAAESSGVKSVQTCKAHLAVRRASRSLAGLRGRSVRRRR